MEGFHPLRVAALDRLTDEAVAVTFEVPEQLRPVFAFRAGQHLALRRELDGEEVRRTYSVCAPVGGPLRIGVKLLEGGLFSTWAVKELQVGDVLEVLPPAGSFGVLPDPGRARRYGLVAGGSGITPLLSVAATVLAQEPASEVALVYGNRTTRDVMFLEELADLKDRHPARLQLLHVLSREEQESELLTGRLDADRLARLLPLLGPVDAWYLCGPFGMVADARAALRAAGATEVHAELFHAEAPPPRPPSQGPRAEATVTAVLHGRTSTVAGDRDTAVLDSLLAVRADAPYACKGGVCGTCRARLVSGEVEMAANYALEPEEVAAGVVLTCQARPLTDAVRVEYL